MRWWLAAFVVLGLAVPAVAYAAVIVCDGGTCKGTNKPDTITGSATKGDDIYGRGGDDTITDESPVGDRIQGGGGADKITAKDGAAEDDIDGNGGGDTIDVQDGSVAQSILTWDRVDCGDGKDTVHADQADIVASNCETVIRS